jgi:hypothetical protein
MHDQAQITMAFFTNLKCHVFNLGQHLSITKRVKCMTTQPLTRNVV